MPAWLSPLLHRPFTITLNDAELLSKGLEELDLDIRNHIEAQAKQQVTIIEAEFVKLTSFPVLDDWSEIDIDTLVTRFDYFLALPLDLTVVAGCIPIGR